MKLITWNVNGLRACMGKGFLDFVRKEAPYIMCVQETKMQEGQADVPLEGYIQFWNSAEKKGYSGTVTFTLKELLSVQNDIDAPGHDREGRTITLEYDNFYIINVYTPNAFQKSCLCFIHSDDPFCRRKIRQFKTRFQSGIGFNNACIFIYSY